MFEEGSKPTSGSVMRYRELYAYLAILRRYSLDPGSCGCYSYNVVDYYKQNEQLGADNYSYLF